MEASAGRRFSLKEWFWAARPKTLPTAIVPFLAGTFLAFARGYQIDWSLMIWAWLSAVCIQVGTNITNDAYDFKRGGDLHTVLGPQRATRAGLLSGRLTFDQVLRVGLVFFAAVLLFGIPLMIHGGWTVAAVLVLSIIAGFLYTGGPYPLAYHGLGDLFVIVFYGFVATGAAYWLQSGVLDRWSLLLSIQIGCLCTTMIAINNLRDVHNDSLAYKRTLPVRFGVLFGRLEITLMAALPIATNFLWPWASVKWLPLLASPLAARIAYKIWTHEPSSAYNEFLALSGLYMLAFCFLQAIGFAFV